MTDAIHGIAIPGQVGREGGHRAIIAGAAAILCLILFGALFPVAALAALRVWVNSRTFNHCFLILPLAIFMIWQRRDALDNAGFAPDFRAAIAIFGLSVAWLVASVASILEAEQFVVMTMVQATLFGVLGATFYRTLAAPFLYLYFLVPSGAFLIPALQAFTARFAVVGLHVLGIPVFSNGAVIEIPAGTFVVAEACAGLRFLVAALAFGVFFAVLTYRSRLRRAAFIALSVVVPIIANGFRALGLIAVAQWIGNPAAALADHILYGWIFFSLVLVILVFVGQLFSDRGDAGGPPRGERCPSISQPKLSQLALVSIACLLAAASGPVAASLLDARPPLVVPGAAPRVALPWHETQTPPEWKPVIETPTRSFSQTFVEGPNRIDRFVALYGAQGRGNNLVRSGNRDADERMWSFNSAHDGTLSVGGHPVSVRVTTWLRGAERRSVWSFYVVNGRPVSGVWGAKRDQIIAHLTASPCVSAYVALSTSTADESVGTTAAARLLEATEPLAAYLCGPTRIPAHRGG